MDPRRHAPAVARNRDPILAILRRELPASGTLLEIASGTGEHAVHFARALPALTFQPSDPDAGCRASIAAHAADAALSNLLPPLALDARVSDSWPAGPFAAILAINLLHISPWEATLGLFAGAAPRLAGAGPLILYGPFRRTGLPLEPSNAAFDASLRARDPRWGLREVEALEQVADAAGLRLAALQPMPANNLTLVFRPKGS
ncbi:MAG: DUF938 domain-containing protein [Sphingomonadaceae bacterium]